MQDKFIQLQVLWAMQKHFNLAYSEFRLIGVV